MTIWMMLEGAIPVESQLDTKVKSLKLRKIMLERRAFCRRTKVKAGGGKIHSESEAQ